MTKYYLPMKVESVSNLREHWSHRHVRTSAQRAQAYLLVHTQPLPCAVTLIRIAPRRLDDDNLVGGFKAIRDGVADKLGAKDNDPRIVWRYSQQPGKPKEYAALIIIEPQTEEHEFEPA